MKNRKMSARGKSILSGKNKKILFIITFGLSLAIFTHAQATAQPNTQASPANTQNPGPPPGSVPAASTPIDGTVNCFDYYKFGSVQVDIASTQNNANPGETMKLVGKLINNNDYPIVEGSVYVKVFKKQTDKDKAHANGFYLIDQFRAKDNVSLPAKAPSRSALNGKSPVPPEPATTSWPPFSSPPNSSTSSGFPLPMTC